MMDHAARNNRPTPLAAEALARRVGAIAVIALIAGCSNDDGIDNTAVTEVTEDDVGRCLYFDEDTDDEIEELPFVIDCVGPRTHEVFSVVRVGGEDVYPGFESLDQTALAECLGDFESYVGISPFDSTLFYSWLVPSLDSWNREDDRDIICIVGPGNGSTIDDNVNNGRLEGSRI